MLDIKPSPNKYLKDYIEIIAGEYEKLGLLALTDKNAKFITAAINLDSAYRGAGDIINEKIQKLKSSKGFENSLKDLIMEVNKTHSTRVSENEIRELAKRVAKIYPSYDELKKGLNKDFKSSDENHLISLLTKHTTKGICHLSLASKVAHTLNKDKYPKYDNVVSSNLASYLKIYLGYKNKNFKIKNNSKDKYKDYLVVYENYLNSIKELLNCQELEKYNLDFEKIDGIIWYSKKGK